MMVELGTMNLLQLRSLSKKGVHVLKGKIPKVLNGVEHRLFFESFPVAIIRAIKSNNRLVDVVVDPIWTPSRVNNKIPFHPTNCPVVKTLKTQDFIILVVRIPL